MINHYIAYYEGMDGSGKIIMNGNISADIENLTDSGEFLARLIDKTLSDAQVKYPSLTRVVIKGIFKL